MDAEANPRPTLVAVAARAGVSPSTASLAFSGAGPVSAATRARVLAAAEELGYAGPDPRAASLRRGRSGIVGVVFDDRLSRAFRDPVQRAMLDGVADELSPAGSALLLVTDAGDGPASVAVAPMDAVILVGCSPRVAESVALVRQRGVPVVAIEAPPLEGVHAIDLDNRGASRRLAEHVRSLGHERVAIVALPLDARERAAGGAPGTGRGIRALPDPAIGTVQVTMERAAGVRDVFPGAPGVVADGSFVESGEVAARVVLERSPATDRPTVIFAQSDLLAVGVIRAARELGLRVPEDLSVLGFDGVKLDGLAADDLTTMRQPAVEKGRAAARAALDLAAGEVPAPVGLVCEFHAGATAGPVPAAVPAL
ncbi:LacI family DNA-binding transcriptional regulator [Galbitalea sp. SE-J8]|uniref:LacI family DNA-binding transcriptional regulator n=1 Tax=Galbitalea sp. SE-J8 TaxID=3054952 RepID=UPI00259CFFB3|nr:LacI family DNA-binding transcriptional regulator [Galbitalea sp. SE-J8]MDM4763306.1 LacI family DNA-binding transcriptional regulator [Galbitalea sp. SE-J8]